MVALDSDEDPVTLFGNMPILSLLMHCLLQIGSARGTNDPSDPAHEMALRVLIGMLKDNSFRDDYPLIPPRRHHALLTAAQTALDQCEARQRPLSAAPTPPPAPSAVDRPRHGLSDDWRYDGELCPALGPHPIPVHYWLDQLIPELNGQGITDGVIQGQVLRQLLHGELRQSLLRRIEQMPSLAAIVSTGRATLKDHYAVALASCCKREDILRCHREATTPQRRPGEPLNLATSRHEQAVRAVASVGCPLAPGTQFWALYGLLTCEENILFTSQPGVPDRLVGTINEPPAAAAARFSALLSDLLSWARTQTSTATASPGGGGGGGRRRNRGAGARRSGRTSSTSPSSCTPTTRACNGYSSSATSATTWRDGLTCLPSTSTGSCTSQAGPTPPTS